MTMEPDFTALPCRCHQAVVHRLHHQGEVAHAGVIWRRRDGTPIGNHPIGPR